MLKTSQLGKRETVHHLLSLSKLSYVEISKKVGVSLAAVYNIPTKISSHSSLRYKPGAGRPRTLRNSIKKSLTTHIRHNPHISLRFLASNLVGDVSHETVRMSLKGMSYTKPYPTLAPILSEIHKISRVKWVKKYKYPAKDWSKTIFVDEMSIWLSRERKECGLREGKKNLSYNETFPKNQRLSGLFHLWEYFHSVSLRKT